MDFLENYFRIQARGSTLKTEVKAGLVNFVANSYQLVLIPQILHNEGKGIEQERYLFSFILTTCISSVLVGVLANLPIPAGVGVGCTTYFAYALVQKESPWGSDGPNDPIGLHRMERQKFGSTVCFMAALCMLLLAVTKLSWKIFTCLPAPVKKAMPVGLGLLLALGGFIQMGLVVNDPKLGELQTFDMANAKNWFPVTVGIVATALAGTLEKNGMESIKALVPMVLATLVKWVCDHSSLPNFQTWTSMWGDILHNQFLDFSLLSHWAGFIMPCVSLYLICLFDVGGITLAVSDVAGLVESDGSIRGANGVFAACAIGSALGAVMGCPPVIVLGESFAGVFAGGRTGLTAIVMGFCFLLALPLAPLFSAIPLFASAPVLVLLGVDLLKLIKFVDMENIENALPSFCTMALMPYLYSIDRAIIAGLVMWVIITCLNMAVKPLSRPGPQPDQSEPLQQPVQQQRSVMDSFGTLHEGRFDSSRAKDTEWSFPRSEHSVPDRVQQPQVAEVQLSFDQN